MAAIKRGVRDIRTISGRVGKISSPHMAFMRISHIELEKARRTKEKEAANHLIEGINARIGEIEAEKAALLRVLEEGNFETPSSPDPDSASKGFKIKY